MLYKYMKFYDEILPELEQFSIDCQKKNKIKAITEPTTSTS